MKNSRLISLIRALTPSELKQFELFVSSEFVNQNTKAIRLLGLIRTAAPDFSELLINKDRLLWEMGEEGSPIKEQQLHDQFSNLLKLLEEFFAYQAFKKKDYLFGEMLLEGLEQHKLNDHYQRVWNRFNRKLSLEPLQSGHHLYYNYRMEQVQEKLIKQNDRAALAEHIGKLSENLDVYFISEKLKTTCAMITGQIVTNAQFKPQLVEEVAQFLKGQGAHYLRVPHIAIYYQIYLTLTDGEETSHFDELKRLLDIHTNNFYPNDAYGMYVYALNYCVRQINRGQDRFREEIFQLFQKLLEKELLIANGYLLHSHYNNICNVALSLKKYDWVNEFLKMYKKRLHPDYQENAYNYNLSVYYYEQKEFGKAMKLLQQVEFTNIFYHINAKNLLLRIFYETEDYDGIKYLTQAFTALLKRNQRVPKYQIQAEQNFIRLIKKLTRLRQRQRVLESQEFFPRWENLTAQVGETKPLLYGRWLKQKLDDLKVGFEG
ncbi:MAG: hypothetical protein AAFQ83_02320 [Bacteroidota bacterium]